MGWSIAEDGPHVAGPGGGVRGVKAMLPSARAQGT